MTRDTTRDDTGSGPEEFRAALAATVEAAVADGIDVRGAWEVETGGSSQDWEIQIVELVREDDD